MGATYARLAGMAKFDVVDLPIPTTAARPEANPLEWQELTPEQRRAAVEVWGLTRSLLELDTTHSRFRGRGSGLYERVLPPIEQRRHNQVVLIDGGRGSGKTALLISLLDRWSRTARQPNRVATTASAAPFARDFEDLCDGTGRVLPLGIIDLRGLSSATSLMMHVASLLHALVDAADEASPRPAVPTDPYARAQSPARTCWDAFVRAASALELRTGNRSSSVDPETFAIELREAERDRLDLHERFSLLIDALVDFVHELRSKQGWPLFVIAIDDADLNPRRALEAFEMLEKFRHPRLLFLLTGHSDAFGPLLRNRMLAEYRAPLQGIPIAALEHDRIGDLPAVESLAKQLYDKVIPPAHRCELRALSPAQRHALISKELAGVRLDHPQLCNLDLLFRAHPELARGLPETMREMVDLRSRVSGLASDRDGAGEFAKLVWDAALAHEHGRVGELVRERPPVFASGEALQIDGRPRYKIDGRVLILDILRRERLRHESTRRGHLAERTLQVCETTGIQAKIPVELAPEAKRRGFGEDPKIEALELSLRCSHAYALVLDVAALSGSLQLHGEQSFGQSGSPVWMNFQAHYLKSIPWTLPNWQGLAQYAIFSRHWTALLEQSDGTLMGLVDAFVRAVVHAHQCNADVPLLGAEPWHRCVQVAYAALPSQSIASWDQQYEKWARGALLQFWYPESGLPRDIRKAIFDAFMQTDRRYDDFIASERAREQRAAVLRQDLGWRVTQTLDSIDGFGADLYDTPLYHDAIEKLRHSLDKGVYRVNAAERGPWLPDKLSGYATRELLNHVGGFNCADLDEVSNIIQSGWTRHSEHRQMLESVINALGIGYRHELRWPTLERSNDQFLRTVDQGDENESTRGPRRAQVAGVDYTLEHAVLHFPDYYGSRSGPVSLFAAIYASIAADDPSTKDGTRPPSAWPQLKVSVGQHAEKPWTWPGWVAYVDLVLIVDHWNDLLRASANLAPDHERLEFIARRFIAVQGPLYRDRKVSAPSESPPDWDALIAGCVAHQLEHERDKPDSAISQRSRQYRAWLHQLHRFARPTAGLSPRAALDILRACHARALLPDAIDEVDAARAFARDEHPQHPWSRLLAGEERATVLAP